MRAVGVRTCRAESNARLVTWSDGSRHLIVGDEYYEVRQHNTGREAPFLYAALGKGVHQSIGHMRQLLKFSLPPGSKASRILLSRAAKAALKSRIDLRAASQRVATEARDRVGESRGSVLAWRLGTPVSERILNCSATPTARSASWWLTRRLGVALSAFALPM